MGHSPATTCELMQQAAASKQSCIEAWYMLMHRNSHPCDVSDAKESSMPSKRNGVIHGGKTESLRPKRNGWHLCPSMSDKV